jgi:hypothetical protein
MTDLSIKAEVEWVPREPDRVVLTLDRTAYSYLIACLTAHAENKIHGTHVQNCGTARTVLDAILKAVESSTEEGR